MGGKEGRSASKHNGAVSETISTRTKTSGVIVK